MVPMQPICVTMTCQYGETAEHLSHVKTSIRSNTTYESATHQKVVFVFADNNVGLVALDSPDRTKLYSQSDNTPTVIDCSQNRQEN